MQQRQLRLGDILDDYCPRERRLTNHAVVAMIGEEVKQTRCTTCEAEHEYKHAKVPRQRRKSDTPAALYAQGAAGEPKRVPHEADVSKAPEIHAVEPVGRCRRPRPRTAIAAPSQSRDAAHAGRRGVRTDRAAVAAAAQPRVEPRTRTTLENVDGDADDGTTTPKRVRFIVR